MKAAFFTLGCKVNQYETESIAEQFGKEGFDIVDSSENADVYVINSCTVTAMGDQKTRQALHRFRRLHPEAVIAVTGCMPQASPDGIEEILPEADVITGSSNRRKLIQAVQEVLESGEKIVSIEKHTKGEPFEPLTIEASAGHTRAFLKIQDGCERYCAYCIIPKARGRLRSKPLNEVLLEAETLTHAGYKEIVLVGINLSCYGIDNGSSLVEAVEAVASLSRLERVRLGSLEPELLTVETMERLAKLPAFCPQFHLSLQSGSKETLKRMRRHYTPEEYIEIVRNIRNSFVNSAITTDIMVGFPGETEEEFEESRRFAQEIGFAKVHVFSYSRRPDTSADTMPNQIDKKTKQARSRAMQQTVDETRARFLEGQVGQRSPILFEEEVNGLWRGYSPNYTPVYIPSEEALGGQIHLCDIVYYDPRLDGCVGEKI